MSNKLRTVYVLERLAKKYPEMVFSCEDLTGFAETIWEALEEVEKL